MDRIRVKEMVLPIFGAVREVSLMVMNFNTKATTCQIYYTLFAEKQPAYGYLYMGEEDFALWGQNNEYIEAWALDKLGLEQDLDVSEEELALITLEEIRAIKIREINKYDMSENINSFELFGQTMWLDRNTRMALIQTAKILDNSGEESTTLWTEGDNPMPVEVSLLELQYILSILEIYAKKCYDVTAQHKYNIQQMDNKEDILAYDHTANYPDKIVINAPTIEE